MHARPVVGGFFIKMLTDSIIWHKWASGDKMKASNWAPLPLMPLPPKITEVVPVSNYWSFTTKKPADNWQQRDFDASGWEKGQAGFGTEGGAHTAWTTDDIWIRRTFTMPEGKFTNLQFYVFHDEDAEIFINGVLAATADSYNTNYEPLKMTPAAQTLLKPGAQITLAIHCHQTEGGQFIDVGLVNVAKNN
jgi:hypothetical protein